jgi:hypothetical protein
MNSFNHVQASRHNTIVKMGCYMPYHLKKLAGIYTTGSLGRISSFILE